MCVRVCRLPGRKWLRKWRKSTCRSVQITKQGACACQPSTLNPNSSMFDAHLHACTHAHTHGLTSNQRIAHATTHIGSMHSCTRAHTCTRVKPHTHTHTHRKRLIDDRAEYAKLTGKTYSLRDWIGLKTQQVLIPKMRVCLKCV